MKKEKLQIVCRKEILKKEINFYGSIKTPYFLPVEIAEWLGVTNARQMIKSADLSEDQKGVFLIDTLGGEQEKVLVNEDGLYDVLIASRKKESKQFKKEIKNYLKQIRINGGTVESNRESEFIENYFPSFGDETKKLMLLDLQKQNEKLTREVSELKKDVEMVDSLMNTNGHLTLKQVADSIEIGRTTLCLLLREKKVLSKQSGYNQPMGKYIKSTYFKTVVQENEKTKHVSIVTLVTPKGLKFIYRLIKRNEMLDEFDTTLLLGGQANA